MLREVLRLAPLAQDDSAAREVLRLAPLAQDDGAARGILLLCALFADVKGASLMRFEM